MNIQYAKLCSLVLQDINHGIPIMPFDISVGGTGRTNMMYHFTPDVELVTFGDNFGVVVQDSQDQDSRKICAFVCSDEVITASPEILDDVVEMGLAAWGGKLLAPHEARTLALKLQPARQIELPDPENPENILTYDLGEITLDGDDVLTRTRTLVE